MEKIVILILFLLLFAILYNQYYLIQNFDSDLNYSIPKITWTYWHNLDSMPLTIKNIMNSKYKILSSWSNNVLSNNNLLDFINKSDFPSNFIKLTYQHQSDWIRLYLLEKYGGVWIDASIIINSEEAINDLYKNTIERNADLMAFYLLGNSYNNLKYTYLENWFLIAPKNSDIIKKWRKEFEYAISIGFNNYYNENLNNENIDLSNYNTTYLTMHMAMSKLCQLNIIDPNKIYFEDSYDDMFKIQDECKWDVPCITEKLKNGEHKKLKYVKLVKINRDDNEELII